MLSRQTPADRKNMALLDAIAAGEEALHTLTGLELRTEWAWYENEFPCDLCRVVRLHSWKTHRLLQPYTRRKLDRERFKKVPVAERTWFLATGEKIKMEDLLVRELRDRETPMVVPELAKLLGIRARTLVVWGTVLGIPLRNEAIREAWRQRKEARRRAREEERLSRKP